MTDLALQSGKWGKKKKVLADLFVVCACRVGGNGVITNHSKKCTLKS